MQKHKILYILYTVLILASCEVHKKYPGVLKNIILAEMVPEAAKLPF